MKQNLKSDHKKTRRGPRPVMLELMREEDIKSVLEIEKQLFGKDAWSAEMFEHDLKLDYACYWSLKRERKHEESYDDDCKSEIIGYAGIYVIGSDVEISNVAIAKEFQGRGYSDLLMEKIVEESLLRGAQMIFLEVDVSNAAAIGLYEKFSFLKVGMRKNYYGAGKDAFVMRLEL